MSQAKGQSQLGIAARVRFAQTGSKETRRRSPAVYRSRLPLYRAADIVLDIGDAESPDEVASRAASSR